MEPISSAEFESKVIQASHKQAVAIVFYNVERRGVDMNLLNNILRISKRDTSLKNRIMSLTAYGPDEIVKKYVLRYSKPKKTAAVIFFGGKPIFCLADNEILKIGEFIAEADKTPPFLEEEDKAGMQPGDVLTVTCTCNECGGNPEFAVLDIVNDAILISKNNNFTEVSATIRFNGILKQVRLIKGKAVKEVEQWRKAQASQNSPRTPSPSRYDLN